MMLMFILSTGALFKLMTLLLLVMSIIFCMNMNVSSWWSLMLFLIYISGMLILFSYFTAFSSKEMIFFDFKLLFLLSVLFSTSTEFYFKESNLFLQWILSNMMFYMLLGIVLFFILLMSCMMCFNTKAPLRSFMM